MSETPQLKTIKLHDPSVYRVFQWLQSTPKNPGTKTEFLNAFVKHFNKTVQILRDFYRTQTGKELPEYRIDKNRIKEIKEEEFIVRQIRQRVLMKLPETEKETAQDRIVLEMDAHMQLDMFYFYFYVTQKGEVSIPLSVESQKERDIGVESLKPVPMPQIDDLPELGAFVGDGYILYAELSSDDFENLDERTLREISAEFIKSQQVIEDSLLMSENLITLKKEGFFLAFLDSPEKAVIVVLIPRGILTEEQQLVLIYSRLMDTLLTAIRLFYIREIYEKRLKHIVFERERELDNLLKWLAEGPKSKKPGNRRPGGRKRRQLFRYSLSLKELEDIVIDIFEEQKKFIEYISQVQEFITVGKIALRNLELISEDHPIEDKEFGRKIGERLKLIVEQMEKDYNMLEITRQQAAFALSSLRARVDIEENRAARVLAVFFGIFAIFEMIQAFPELSWQVRVGITIIGPLAVWLIVKHKFDTLARFFS